MSEDLRRERDFYRQLVELVHAEQLEPLLEQALELVLEMSGAQRGYLALFPEADARAPEWSIARGFTAGDVDRVLEQISTTVVQEALSGGRTLQIASLMDDERFSSQRSVELNKIEAVLCAPVGQPALGVIYLQGHPGGPFPSEANRWVEHLARHLEPLAGRLLERVEHDGEDPSLPWRRRLGGVPLVGRSPAFAELLRQVAMVADHDLDVLLLGPTGTGKNAVARLLAERGGRRDKPFMHVNCAALPETLFEAELFGAEKGAHSTALEAREGLVGAAHGGTLFLDELGELELGAQAKLLQLLQERTYRRLGSSRQRDADIRVIAATNRDLRVEVREGRFREDLLYRLSVFTIAIPPLTRRREDIPELLTAFLRQSARKLGMRPLRPDAGAIRVAVEAPWPGNLRELEHAAARALLVAHNEGARSVGAQHLLPASDVPDHPSLEGLDWASATRLFQRQLLEQALAASGGNVSAAARQLGLARSHLYTLMEQHGLER